MSLDRGILDEGSVPRLPRGVRLTRDQARDRWVLQAPERVFVLDEIAVEILRACDGHSTVAGIVDRLASRYNAPRETILGDVLALLRGFADKGVVRG